MDHALLIQRGPYARGILDRCFPVRNDGGWIEANGGSAPIGAFITL